jgi:hypothetical protein
MADSAQTQLAGLPARGLLTASTPGLRGNAVIYVSTADTSPPPGHQIQTDSTHILVRALQSKKAKDEKAKPSGEGAAKRARLAEELKGSTLTKEMVAGFTADKVKAALAQRGLPQTGNKEVLVQARSPRCTSQT